MKKYFFYNTAVISLSAFTFLACSNNDDSSDSNELNGMQTVRFEMKSDNELSAVATGNTAVIDGVAKKEYIVTTEKSDMIDVPSLSRESNIESTLLYPGSILRGSSFINGNYDPLVLKNSFKPVDLYLTIKGSSNIGKNSVLPKGSAIFQAISDLRLDNKAYFRLDYIPANYTFESTEINNEESFIKSNKIHAKANYAKLVSTSFNYSNSTSSTNKTKYVLVKLNQTVYSVGIDPKYKTDWIDGDITKKEAGDYEPVYISSVDYGRIAYILVETSLNTQEVKNIVESSIKVGIGKVGGNVDYTKNEEFKTLFSSNKVHVSVMGGNSKNIITDYDSFLKYLKLEATADDLIASSAPISYTVRRLLNNTQISIVNQYKDITREYR